MSAIMTEAELLKLLRQRVSESTQIAFAQKHKLDRSLLNRILAGNKSISIAVAYALGYYPVKAFMRFDDGSGSSTTHEQSAEVPKG